MISVKGDKLLGKRVNVYFVDKQANPRPKTYRLVEKTSEGLWLRLLVGSKGASELTEGKGKALSLSLGGRLSGSAVGSPWSEGGNGACVPGFFLWAELVHQWSTKPSNPTKPGEKWRNGRDLNSRPPA